MIRIPRALAAEFELDKERFEDTIRRNQDQDQGIEEIAKRMTAPASHPLQRAESRGSGRVIDVPTASSSWIGMGNTEDYVVVDSDTKTLAPGSSLHAYLRPFTDLPITYGLESQKVGGRVALVDGGGGGKQEVATNMHRTDLALDEIQQQLIKAASSQNWSASHSQATSLEMRKLGLRSVIEPGVDDSEPDWNWCLNVGHESQPGANLSIFYHGDLGAGCRRNVVAMQNAGWWTAQIPGGHRSWYLPGSTVEPGFNKGGHNLSFPGSGNLSALWCCT
ncbi:hypothetical protein B0H19DRAFT_1241420 [Mycena capillaripes]|nr:hypothetical protein B0H19DRAFT_1241420 [Mycena capillaripes]